MASTAPWRPLSLPASSGIPPLLVSMDAQVSSYTIRLTDMANMWEEKLERKAICMRGWSENTTIDPSDTPENMTQFLSLIHAALDPLSAGHERTSTSLSPKETSDGKEGAVTLRITCELPGLQPLKWPVHLDKKPISAIATALVLPLVQAHYSRARQVSSLAQLLAQKDGIITKLVDKLEASGVGLEHVFNPLTGKKKVTRAVAEDKVTGLAPFKESQWSRAMVDDADGPDNVTALVRSVFGAGDLRCNELVEVDESPKLDDWWLSFDPTKEVPLRSLPSRGQKEEKGKEKSSPRGDSGGCKDDESNKGTPMDEDDDEFQVQSTPPHLASGTKHKVATRTQEDDDTETGSEDEDNVPATTKVKSPPTRKSPDQKPAKPAPRLGGIGSKKQTAPPPKEPTPPPTKADDGSETASDVPDNDDENDATASEAESPPPAPSPVKASVPQKGRLGRIGKIGGAAQAKDNHDGASTSGNGGGGAASSSAPARPPPKLGAIGKKNVAEPESTRGRKTAKEPETARETSQERADRRREEVKRELEKQAAAGPAKKKRRF